MNTLWGYSDPPELPDPPNRRGLNVTHVGAVDAGSFDRLYGRYKDTEHYEDARVAFHSPSLNRALVTGVNTWHEQVLAGRVTLDDLKIMGYGNLAKHRKNTTIILEALTRDRDRLTATEVKSALVSSKTTLMFGLNPPMRDETDSGVIFALHFVTEFKQDAKRLRYQGDVYRVAGGVISSLVKKDYAKALKLAVFVDTFFAELQQYIAPGALRPYDKHSYPIIYKGSDFTMLMDAGFSPSHAAKSLIHGLSVARAIEGQGVPDSLVDGVL